MLLMSKIVVTIYLYSCNNIYKFLFQNGLAEWGYHFIIGGTVYIFCGTVFILFGSVKEQSWNEIKDTEPDQPTQSAAQPQPAPH